MTTKTSELQGAALDWAVAKCELLSGQNYTLAIDDDGIAQRVNFGGMYPEWSSDWQEAGPIIEREMITVEWIGEDWMACIWCDEKFLGPTPLIAAMRAYVASKLGDEVEIPGELLAQEI
jgi:hypothetical protein